VRVNRLRPLRASVGALTIAAAVALGGCSTPAPAPTPTGFANEAEAFAAAEQTYRAYVDALNRVDLSDPSTFEDVYKWTTGDLNASDRESFSTYHAEGFTVTGDTITREFAAQTYDAATGEVVAIACSDISQINVVNVDGESQVADDRPNLYELSLTFTRSNSPENELLISNSKALEPERCA
jgi:hypothetical protein